MTNFRPAPLVDVIDTSVAPVQDTAVTKVPMITWGGDLVTIMANGNSTRTQADSIFARKGLNLELVRQDDFKQQLRDYLSGRTPYLRCTVGMCNQAAELLNRNPETRPIVIYQMTWSKGGDGLVAKDGILKVDQLREKTVALQAYGPHVDFMTTLLSQSNLSIDDINLRWMNNLTLSPQSPPEAFREDEVDAAFMVLPDALTLTSNRQVGTGSKGSVRGARLITSTMYASRIIADLYVVRADYLEQHGEKVKAFVTGLLQAQSETGSIMAKLNSPERIDLLGVGAGILLDAPEALADMENLYLDADPAGLEGNLSFLSGKGAGRNLQALNDELQTAFEQIGLVRQKSFLTAVDWDFSRL
ncbi:MAG: ABC transporter substrate-binding protein [Endozoicomonas sp.]